MTSKTLTDSDGGTLAVIPHPEYPGHVLVYTEEATDSATAGPFDPADLIAAIREAAGETDDKPEPAPAPSATPTAEDFAKAQFARHEDGRIAMRLDYDSRPWAAKSPVLVFAWLSDADMAAEGWSIVTPAPSTPREALALAVSLAYEPEGDTMPDQPGFMTVAKGDMIHAHPDGSPCGLPVRGNGYRRLLLDPPAPVTPARPEGAERYESLILDQMGGDIDPAAARDLADRIAREVEA